ncbi:MAG: hypothetical protein IJB97_05395 [Clostridia bacterium]|nr:hypothetical protein [Clostridia bacterium]
MTEYAILWILFFVIVILSLTLAGFLLAKLSSENTALKVENEALANTVRDLNERLEEAAVKLVRADEAKERANAEKN